MEWAIDRQNNQRIIFDDIADRFSYRAPEVKRTENPYSYIKELRTIRAREALL